MIVNNYEIETFDDVFSYHYRLFLYNFCVRSAYRLGWEDTNEIENGNHKYFFCSWNQEDIQKTNFINEICKQNKIKQIVETHNLNKVVVNLSYPNAVYFAHTHNEEKVLLYYVNIQWKQEWAGETLFFDESGKEIIYASPYIPNRILIFDGKMPHTIRPQSSAAPHFRFTLSTFWSLK